jgi:hypothetical protein
MPADSRALSVTDRQALLAAWRALQDNDPLQRVQALWEAFDAYADEGGAAVRFEADDIARTLAATAAVLRPEQQQRLQDLIPPIVNQPSLKIRLPATLEREGVALDRDERKLLWKRLRPARNLSTQAKAVVPSNAEINRGRGVRGRALVHRMHHRRDETTKTSFPPPGWIQGDNCMDTVPVATEQSLAQVVRS